MTSAFVECAGVLLVRSIFDGLEVLLTREHGSYGLPKGHVETGEATPKAALRELCEETGIRRVDVELLYELPPIIRSTRDPERDGAESVKRIVMYLGFVEYDRSLSHDRELSEWIFPREVPKRLFFPEDKAWAEQALRVMVLPR